MKFIVYSLATGMLLALMFACTASEQGLKQEIDWQEFMTRHDLIWEEIPLQWNEGAFVGNGQMGMMIYASMEDNVLNFHMGRQDVTDHRKAPDKKTSMGVKGAGLLDYSRLDIGRMKLQPAGKIRSMSVRQDLWNAEVRGTITTDLGEITFRAFTPYDQMLNVIEINSTEKKNSEDIPYRWEWKAGNPVSPRVLALADRYADSDYLPNPKPVVYEEGDVSICRQSLLAGGDYATAWMEKTIENPMQSTLFVSIANEIPAAHASAGVAKQVVEEGASLGVPALEETHRAWWHRYLQKSFLSIPDARMESFYWIQLYKMASCSRADGPALDLNGPFLKITQWPGLWWNLNVQLTYWPFNTSNHQDIAINFIHLIDEYFDTMLENRFSGGNLGDFAWALHNYWLYFSYQGDFESIQEKWVPKAMQVSEVYEGKLVRNDGRQLELSEMSSPEYLGFKKFPNTNYNLAILRWLLNALIESNERANTNGAEVEKWRQILEDLVPYPVNENGLMIASNQPVHMSHRHYSHLLGLYPLFQLNPDSPEDRELVDRSVVHWHRIEDGKGLAGYSYTGAASLYAALGRGNDAMDLLQYFLSDEIGGGSAVLLPNTFYTEGRGKNPVIETPLSGAASIMELLLQSWGGKIRVFPAVPDVWETASFDRLRAQGGFLVSASRSLGKTEWVSIRSEKGEPCILKVPGWSSTYQVDRGERIRIKEIGEGEFQIELEAGQDIVLAPAPDKLKITISPVFHSSSENNYYGVKKGENFKENMDWPVPDYKY